MVFSQCKQPLSLYTLSANSSCLFLNSGKSPFMGALFLKVQRDKNMSNDMEVSIHYCSQGHYAYQALNHCLKITCLLTHKLLWLLHKLYLVQTEQVGIHLMNLVHTLPVLEYIQHCFWPWVLFIMSEPRSYSFLKQT